MGSQPERAGEGAPCLSLSPRNNFSPPLWQNIKSLSSLAFCSCHLSTPGFEELPFPLHSLYPVYPLLPPPYLFIRGAPPSIQCSPVFMLPQDTSYPTRAVPSMLMSVNEPGHHSAWGEILRPYPGAPQASGQTQPSQAWNPGSGAARTYSIGPEHASRAAPEKRVSLGSRVGTAALPYPLKKENGRILYECKVCSKRFGQLSNLKVSASRAPLFPQHPLMDSSSYPASRIKDLKARRNSWAVSWL